MSQESRFEKWMKFVSEQIQEPKVQIVLIIAITVLLLAFLWAGDGGRVLDILGG